MESTSENWRQLVLVQAVNIEIRCRDEVESPASFSISLYCDGNLKSSCWTKDDYMHLRVCVYEQMLRIIYCVAK